MIKITRNKDYLNLKNHRYKLKIARWPCNIKPKRVCTVDSTWINILYFPEVDFASLISAHKEYYGTLNLTSYRLGNRLIPACIALIDMSPDASILLRMNLTDTSREYNTHYQV